MSDGAGAGHALIGKERAIRPFRHGNFGVDVGAAFLIVALGKRPPMPYVWLPQRVGRSSCPASGYGRSEHCCGPQELVEVPNPAKFLG